MIELPPLLNPELFQTGGKQMSMREERRKTRYFIQNSVVPPDYRPRVSRKGQWMLYLIYCALVIAFVCYVLIDKKG